MVWHSPSGYPIDKDIENPLFFNFTLLNSEKGVVSEPVSLIADDHNVVGFSVVLLRHHVQCRPFGTAIQVGSLSSSAVPLPHPYTGGRRVCHSVACS